MSLETFANIPEMQNVQTRFIGGLDIDTFAFVGLTEKYNESITLFNEMFHFNTNIDADSLMGNINPDKKNKKYDLDNRTRCIIQKVNALDMELYQKGTEKFISLMEKYSGTNPFNDDHLT